MSDLALHAVRIGATLVVFAWAPGVPMRVACAAALFFALFALAHDLAHGALGLSRRANAWLLSGVSAAMLVSGRAMRRMHLRHHARPLAADDYEGRGARRTLLGALLASPFDAVTLRVAAFRTAPRRERVIQALETAAALAFVGVGPFAPLGVRIYLGVAVVLEATMGLWAAYVPHHAPAIAAVVARRLAFLRSPTLASLAFHDAHHRRPRVPCHRLVDGAR